MNDKIKERLTFNRLNYSLSILAIFGIVGWMYGVYEKFELSIRLYTGLGVLFFLILFVFLSLYKITNLHKKL